MLKSMKSSKRKTNTKSKNVAVDSTSTIKMFFKNAPNNSNFHVEEKECSASDSHSVYVQALKNRLKSYNGETEKANATTIQKQWITIQNNNEGADVVKSSERNNCEGAGIMEPVTDDRNNRKQADVVDSGTDEEKDDNVVGSDEKKADKLCDASCELLRKKYKDLKKSHFQICHKYCELSTKYEQLVETLDAIRKAKSSNDEVSDVLSSTDDVFTHNQIRILESIPFEQKKDSTFVLQCIEYAYKGNASSLVNKTLFGTLERKEFGDDGAVVVRPAKDPLTPEKVKRIEELFVKRVTESNCIAAEFTERIKNTNINRLIASAIRNVSNKEMPKQSKKNSNLNL